MKMCFFSAKWPCAAQKATHIVGVIVWVAVGAGVEHGCCCCRRRGHRW